MLFSIFCLLKGVFFLLQCLHVVLLITSFVVTAPLTSTISPTLQLAIAATKAGFPVMMVGVSYLMRSMLLPKSRTPRMIVIGQMPLLYSPVFYLLS